jgi:hypothetical protein
MNLSANRGHISTAERARRIAQGLCNYCGGTGHFAAQCPARPNRPLRGAAGQVVAENVGNGGGEPQMTTAEATAGVSGKV